MFYTMNWIAWVKNIELTTENRKIPLKQTRAKENSRLLSFSLSSFTYVYVYISHISI